MKIKLLADSACSVPKHIIEKYDIEILPLGIIFDGKEYKDGVTITDEQFFKMQETCEKNPTTSQVNQYEWKEAFEKFLGEYDHLVVMTLSSKLSGTYQSAQHVINELGAKNIHLFDTQGVSIPCGLCVYETAKVIASGADIETVKKSAQSFIDRVDVYATFESLKYLKAGGRMSSLTALIGSMLKVKIILSCRNGEVAGIEKVISTKKALRRIKDIVKEDFDPTMSMFFGEGDHKDFALSLAREYQEELGISDWELAPIGATVGVHTGPRSVGVAYFKKPKAF